MQQYYLENGVVDREQCQWSMPQG